ncbi:MAG: fibronectin type III domain-containing protein, partial [Solirubrobacteraceae bacterium]
ALLWRYVTKYESKDGSEEPYVMVHDARISVGEGEWVFVPRSCLPASLPQSKGEQLPLKPTIATGTASGVTTSEATLNGTVNPNGIEATYYFEYGTSTSYGGLTYPGDAGTGGVTEPESYSISGLMPGTTYHYRIMAYSDTGLSEGTDQTFTTQALPPEVSTSPASEVQQAQATLNGTVNPKSTDTHYYFEYGKTTEYGTDVPALPGGDAGSGASSVAVSATATGLEAGVTYHYRLFASNTGGLERGSDQTYTMPVPTIAFQATSDTLWSDSSASAGGWSNTTMGMRENTSPSIAALPEGKYVVAFQAVNGTKGELWTYSSNGEYHNTQLGMEPGTSPSVVALPEGKYVVAFQASSGELWTYSSSGEYHGTTLGMKPGTSPSVTALPGGKYVVAFQAANGELWTYSSNGEYHNTTLAMGPGTSPSVAAVPQGKYEVAFQAVNGSKGELWTYSSNGEYHDTTLGVREGTSPSIEE